MLKLTKIVIVILVSAFGLSPRQGLESKLILRDSENMGSGEVGQGREGSQ